VIIVCFQRPLVPGGTTLIAACNFGKPDGVF